MIKVAVEEKMKVLGWRRQPLERLREVGRCHLNSSLVDRSLLEEPNPNGAANSSDPLCLDLPRS
jgi:hypothetical protein